MEDRAPKIQNTAAWTIRLDQQGNNNSAQVVDDIDWSENNGTSSLPWSSLAIGGAWQINRGIGLKAILRQDSITTAIVGKRWKEPRMTCSLLYRYGFGNTKSGFLGIGLELETGQLGKVEYADAIDGVMGNDKDVPETKTSLPSGLH